MRKSVAAVAVMMLAAAVPSFALTNAQTSPGKVSASADGMEDPSVEVQIEELFKDARSMLDNLERDITAADAVLGQISVPASEKNYFDLAKEKNRQAGELLRESKQILISAMEEKNKKIALAKLGDVPKNLLKIAERMKEVMYIMNNELFK